MIREPSVVLIPCCTKPLSKVALPTQYSYSNSEQDKFFGKTILRLLSIRYCRYAASLLVGMGRKMVGWGGQILWETEMLEDMYRVKAESDLTKTQNC